MLLLPPVEDPVPPVLVLPAEEVVVDVDKVVGVVEVLTAVVDFDEVVVGVVVVPLPPPVPGRH
jgi:hypothetical protein